MSQVKDSDLKTNAQKDHSHQIRRFLKGLIGVIFQTWRPKTSFWSGSLIAVVLIVVSITIWFIIDVLMQTLLFREVQLRRKRFSGVVYYFPQFKHIVLVNRYPRFKYPLVFIESDYTTLYNKQKTKQTLPTAGL